MSRTQLDEPKEDLAGHVKPNPPEVKSDPLDVARKFKYYTELLLGNSSVVKPESSMKVTRMYRDNKKYIDKINDIVIKYRINLDEFIKFCISDRGISDIRLVLDKNVFQMYGEHLRRIKQYNNIHKYYIKSATYIARRAIELGISVNEFVSLLIHENRIGYEMSAGNISKYYIATLKDFELIFSKLDAVNRDELGIIYNVYGELCHDVNVAFMNIEGRYIRPMQLANEIYDKLNKNNN